MNTKNLQRSMAGFTLIELLVVIIVVGILGSLVAVSYSGVQAKKRNGQRQADVSSLKATLETYYAQHSQYPTLASINDPAFRAQNFKELSAAALQDPSWSTASSDCPASKQVVSAPASKCYAYQVTASDGSVCDNDKVICAQYTLTTLLEGGEKYVKSSLN